MKPDITPDIECRARVRHKYWLLRKWEKAVERYDGPGKARLVTGYRPSGFVAPANVEEIAGLIVWDKDRIAHHFRLYRDELVVFIECPQQPDARIIIDPMVDPVNDTIYLSGGVPKSVTAVVEALGLDPRWENACQDGRHEWDIENQGSDYEFWRCEVCELPRTTISWIGHGVPNHGGERDER